MLHSRLGIVSFGLSLLYAASLLALKIVDSYSLNEKEYTGFILVGLIALGLGIAGIAHRQRDRLFPLLGLIINSACLLTSLTDFYFYWSNR